MLSVEVRILNHLIKKLWNNLDNQKNNLANRQVKYLMLKNKRKNQIYLISKYKLKSLFNRSPNKYKKILKYGNLVKNNSLIITNNKKIKPKNKI
jgi:hypothetical protein